MNKKIFPILQQLQHLGLHVINYQEIGDIFVELNVSVPQVYEFRELMQQLHKLGIYQLRLDYLEQGYLELSLVW